MPSGITRPPKPFHRRRFIRSYFAGILDASDAILDMRTGLRIVNTTEGEIASCEITYPSGDTEEFTGPDADAILDRAEQLATASTALINQLNVLTTNQPGGSAK